MKNGVSPAFGPAKTYVRGIAGVRTICNYDDDIYLAEKKHVLLTYCLICIILNTTNKTKAMRGYYDY